ncbi:Arginine/lysine/ornithine decarboxylase [Lachnospiraceae bacterium NK3A20]|nr:Arginine/lysine/ornithine decarboxylase [Lachnospiraceae bacterium NK3A20]
MGENVEQHDRTDLLKQQLESYIEAGLYPFHMPGHKRRVSPARNLPVDYDMTEVEGVDDLHHAEGILQAAMERTAELFGAKRSWYLVGGSTVGNLAAIRAVAPFGSEIIAARNCHKSVYHAIELGNLTVHWIWPELDAAFDIYGSVRPETVQKALEQYPNSRAVILTSPTYEGVISDITSIAAICHAHRCTAPGVQCMGVPLVVDEAHGAHLGLFAEGGFPASSVRCGADIAIQSTHKTLPSLTQTALLHVTGDLVYEREIEQQLNIFETSSPSYLLMTSLDGCTGLLREKGRDMFAAWGTALTAFSELTAHHALRHLHILGCGDDDLTDHPAIYAFDKSKILVSCRDTYTESEEAKFLPGFRVPASADVFTGADLAAQLRQQYHLETEMHCGSNVLCMTSCCDDFAAYAALAAALQGIDSGLFGERDITEIAEREERETASTIEGLRDRDFIAKMVPQAQTACTIAEAVRKRHRSVSAAESVGQVSAEYIYPYPPGIPVLVPGEVITQENLDLLEYLRAAGAEMIASSGRDDLSLIEVCDDSDLLPSPLPEEANTRIRSKIRYEIT